ncbi:MAG: FHA domain-containing protein [Planctomycetes bacterium]|nr:FHA domain-containing protein [Planctomycetota bacterium]
MSLIRLIIWSSLLGGWCAFFGWLFAELLMGRFIAEYKFLSILMATIVAVPIGGGISLAYGLTNPSLETLGKRALFGFAGGFAGGLVGVLLGSCVFGIVGFIAEKIGFGLFIGRSIGWALIGTGIGVGIGASEGILDRSFGKMRNGVLGGVLGGALGGLVFHPVSLLASDMSSRALSFVLLGLAIGLFIGLAQVILKDAWITVEDGFRPGRQMILGNEIVTMGTSEKSSLIFIAYGAKDVEPTHLKISKQEDGRYVLEDNQSRKGTLLNGKAIAGPTPLSDGDAIQFGINVVRFNESTERPPTPTPPAASTPAAVPEAVPKTVPIVQTTPIKAEPAPAPTAVQAAPPKPAPAPLPAPKIEVQTKPAPPKPAPAQPTEAPCPSCGKRIVGLPGQRFCKKCFQTF